MWSTEDESHHFIRCSRGAYALKLVGEYAAVGGVIGLITAASAAALQSIRPSLPVAPLKIALFSGALLVIGYIAVSLAWRWVRRAGFAWNYDKNGPHSPHE